MVLLTIKKYNTKAVPFRTAFVLYLIESELQPIAFGSGKKKKYFIKYPFKGIDLMGTVRIFVSVFHRILDFKDGAGFLSWPHFFCS